MKPRICDATGLTVLDGPVAMYRVSISRPDRGPLNPIYRPLDPAIDRKEWNRFDTPGQTIYGADQRATAFTESMAYKSPAACKYAALAEEAAFLGVGIDELKDELRQNGIPIDGLDADWRLDRQIYLLEFPSLTWVDLTAPETVSRIRAAGFAAANRFTISDLTGDDRTLTTAVATWIRAQTLDTGHQPAGLRYPSKFGVAEGDHCWAGYIEGSGFAGRCSGEAFRADDPDLVMAINRTGVPVG